MKRLLTLALLMSAAACARADSPPDWLKLPPEGGPRPSGASAWILVNSQHVTQESESTVLFRYRLAFMILSEAGAEHAQFSAPFPSLTSSVATAKAWAMSPDGRQCREFGANEFVVASTIVNNWSWDLTKQILFDARRYVQPGWIVAFDVQIRSESNAFDVRWSPRSNIPERSVTLELTPLPGGSVKWKSFSPDLPAPSGSDGHGGLSWSLTDLPGYDQNVPSRTERNSMELRAYLLTTPDQTKSWGDVVRLASAEMDPKAVATPNVSSLARSLAGTGGLWSRIEPVCHFVQKGVSYLQVTIDSDSMAGYRPHAAGDVCDNRYGDCKDKAVLLRTMLGVIGVDAHVMLVNSGIPRANIADWPSANFNHAIVAIPCGEPAPKGSTVVRVDGEDYFLFDPTDDQVSFGLLPMADAGGLGLILAPGVDTAVLIPPFPADEVTISSKVGMALADDGSAVVDISEDRFGLAAADAISRDETVSFKERTGALEGRIQRRVPLISGLTWDRSDDEAAHSWSSKVHFSAQFVGKRMPGGMYVTTDLMSVVPNSEPWDGDPAGWVPVTPGTTLREITVTPPAGWDFSELPQDWSAKSPAGEGSMRCARDGRNVKESLGLSVVGGSLDHDGYVQLRALMRAAIEAEHRPIVLRRRKPPAAAASPAPATH